MKQIDQLAMQRMYDRQIAGETIAPTAITKADIAEMGKSDLRELIEAHGAAAPAKIGDMRNMLAEIMFVEIE